MVEHLLISDCLYGDVRITDPLIVELISLPMVQRLKRISQFGIPDKYYFKDNYSRFEHSIGVMVLLGKLGASQEEQIAGLLHDVSHKAFSHVYDWVVADYSGSDPQEDYQDQSHSQFMANSSAVKTLQEFGLETEKVLNYHDNFGLLEREIPDLCADRVDYSLREMPKDLAARILNSLRVKDGRIICGDFETAAIFARKFLNLQQEHWGSYEAVSRYFYFSQMLKRALSLGAISLEDFLKDDNHVMSLVEASSDRGIRQALKFLERKYIPRAKDGQTIFKKFRYIDPLFLDGDKTLRLSSVDMEFQEMLKEAKKEHNQGVLVDHVEDLK